MSETTMQGLLGLQILSGGFGLFIFFLGIAWWVLSIILFFKIWGMTDNISKMKDLLQEQLDIEHPYANNTKEETSTQDK